MELIEGNDLSGPLPLTEALQIARQIAEGFPHRDLPSDRVLDPLHSVQLLLAQCHSLLSTAGDRISEQLAGDRLAEQLYCDVRI